MFSSSPCWVGGEVMMTNEEKNYDLKDDDDDDSTIGSRVSHFYTFLS